MRQGEITQQVDGAIRHLWETPRGTVAVDEARDGSLYAIATLGYRATDRQRKRDEREALRRTREAVAS